MDEFDCPKCAKTNEVELDDLPSQACDTELMRCNNCGAKLQVGWVAMVVAHIDSSEKA